MPLRWLSFFLWLVIYLPVYALSGDTLEIRFEHYFGDMPLHLDTALRTPAGDTVFISKVQYYVGQVRVRDARGKLHRLDAGYHLVRVNEASHIYVLRLVSPRPIPAAKSLSFVLGIADKDNRQQNTGDLHPQEGMFWSWEDGYIFAKIEGYYFTSAARKRGLVYHLGRKECFTNLEIGLASPQKSTISIRVNLEKLFGYYTDAPITVSLKQNSDNVNVMGGNKAVAFMKNFSKAFISAR